MNRIWYIVVGLLIIFTFLFLFVNWIDIPFLSSPEYLEEENSIMVMSISILLLASDLFLPVPGSIIMMGNGAVFGIVLGTTISLTGSLLSSVLGFFIGSRFKRLANKLISNKDFHNGKLFIEKYGQVAIIASRPVPLMSETVIILTGILGYDFRKMAINSFLGLLPASLIYALIGVALIDPRYSIFSLLIALLLSGLIWVIGIFWSRIQIKKPLNNK